MLRTLIHPSVSLRRTWRLVVALSLAAAVTNTSVARVEPVFEPLRLVRYGVAEGLSQSSVTAIVEDGNGFLWVGTQDGLNRFDGYEFHHLRPDPQDPHALDDGSITAIAPHPDGSVWVGTLNGGLGRYDTLQDRFELLRAGAGSALPDDRVTALAIHRDGTVWVGTTLGLARAAGSASQTLNFAPVSAGAVASLQIDADNRLWAGYADGTITVFTPDGGTVFTLAPGSIFAPRVAIRAIAASTGGAVWIASDGAAFVHVNRTGGVLARHIVGDARGAPGARLRTMEVDDEGRLWLGGLGMGLAAFDVRDHSWIQARHRSLDPHSLSHDDVVSLRRSRAGQLWVGTLGGGLNQLRLRPSGFAHHWHQPGNPSSLSHNTVTSFADARDGTVWVGTDGGGLNRFEIATSIFSRVSLGAGADVLAGLERIWSVHVDSLGGLWVGTWGAGLHYRAPGRDRFVHMSAVPGSVISAMLEDAEALWVATVDAGLSRISKSGALLGHYLKNENVTALAHGADGHLWAGSWSNGLYLLDSAAGSVTRYSNVPTQPGSLPHNAVRALAVDGKGMLWVATGGGLARFDAANHTFDRYGKDDGLPAGTLYGLEIDPEARLWLSTNAGLVRFDPERRTVRFFGPEEGVQDFEFNGGARLALPNGLMFFGGLNGFNVFDPLAIPPAMPPGPVQITEVVLADRSAAPRWRDPTSPLAVSAVGLQSLAIGHRERVLEFRFVSPLPTIPSQLRYAYRLDDLDSTWRLTGSNRREAVYTNLAAGSYVFRVRAINADGVWSEMERTVALRVHPPWWNSNWAYIAYALLAMLTLVAFVQGRTRSLRAHAQLLEERIEQRTAQLARQTHIIEEQARHLRQASEEKDRLFARVSHEFRTPLTLIVGPIDALLAGRNRDNAASWLRLMRRNARRLQALVDQLLGLARLSAEVPPSMTPQAVAPVVRGALMAFESMAESNGIQLLAPRLDPGWVRATPELLERIVTNLISNAMKYTPPGGHVHVRLCNEGGMISLAVVDDGPGIPFEQHSRIFEPFHRATVAGEGSGIGLALVRECVQALGGSITLDSAPGKGSTFSVLLTACEPPQDAARATADDIWQSERIALEAEVVAEQARPVEEIGLIAARAEDRSASGRPSVLIVEDNDDLRVMLHATLATQFQCRTVDNGRLGVDTALEDPPDLVLSDVMMSEIDGFELTRVLKRDARTSHVPIVLLTALGDRDSRLRGLEEQADDYLVKPFDADELTLRIRNLIEARQILSRRAARSVYDGHHPTDGEGKSTDSTVPAPRERAFLERLRAAAVKGHTDSEFGVAELARAVAMSERQLQRKLHALLYLTPAEYLRELRLQRAAELLRAGELAGNVALDVGFSSHSHFSACFKARFGVTPVEHARGGNITDDS